KKSAEAVKDDGRIFIYTRLRSQNARSVWGECFPSFNEMETRLYERDEMEARIQSVGLLKLETTKTFRFNRCASLEQLVEKVHSRHYSTFSLYEEDRLDKALNTFQENIRKRFPDTRRVAWTDENILLVLRPK
ncbi:MAG: hypothetical protein ACE5J1_04690, partial [Nitrospiria bacterium]